MTFALPWAYLLIMYLGKLSQGTEIILIAVYAGMTAAGSIHLARVYPAAIAYMMVMIISAISYCFYPFRATAHGNTRHR